MPEIRVRAEREVLRMFMRASMAVIAACLLAIGGVGMVAASSSGSVTITVTGINGVETFTTTGGILCDSGTSENTFEKFGGAVPSHAGTFHGYKTLTCTDGSGTFKITYDAAVVWGAPQDQGGWKFYGGTGDYAGCSGGGYLVGTYITDGIVDVYTGNVYC